jgi:trk system potassium uptake protein TrkA
MRIIVVGCGRAGAEVALRMFRKGHEVVVVDAEGAALATLHADFRGRTVQGDALAGHVLESAGIAQANGLAAVTNSDTVNAVVAHAARVLFKVPRIAVRSYAPSRGSIHEAFGHEAVSSTAWGASRLEELLEDPAGASEGSLGNGDLKIYPVAASVAGRDPALAASHAGCLLVAVTRAGLTGLPAAGFRTAAGDVLHVAATASSIVAFRRSLAAAERS